MSEASRPQLLAVEGLSVEFQQVELPVARAVDDISFTLQEGEVLGVVGESGCGKTTLALSLLRLLPGNGRIVGGRIDYLGRDLLDLSEGDMTGIRWRHIAMVFQGAMNALNPVRTVGDQIAEAIRRHLPEVPPEEVERKVRQLLDTVGINPARRNDYPHQYSGGMRQRAVIAMALACTPSILIADEPTTALDVMIQAQILRLLSDLKHELGLSLILVTHDLGVVAEMCDHVLVMYGGVAAEIGTVDDIFNSPCHPYTRALLQAFPDISRPAERMRAIPGTPPRLDPPPAGCRFAERCPEVMDRCRVEAPAAHVVGPGHQARCHLVQDA
jgi:oligopeptide/dipeptide ABC transporter ATP-binding protein